MAIPTGVFFVQQVVTQQRSNFATNLPHPSIVNAISTRLSLESERQQVVEDLKLEMMKKEHFVGYCTLIEIKVGIKNSSGTYRVPDEEIESMFYSLDPVNDIVCLESFLRLFRGISTSSVTACKRSNLLRMDKCGPYGQLLELNIISASNLPKMDFIGSVDPYVVMHTILPNVTLPMIPTFPFPQTYYIDDNYDPVWDQRTFCEVPVSMAHDKPVLDAFTPNIATHLYTGSYIDKNMNIMLDMTDFQSTRKKSTDEKSNKVHVHLNDKSSRVNRDGELQCQSGPMLWLEVFDHDNLSSDDIIGSVLLNLTTEEQITSNSNTTPTSTTTLLPTSSRFTLPIQLAPGVKARSSLPPPTLSFCINRHYTMFPLLTDVYFACLTAGYAPTLLVAEVDENGVAALNKAGPIFASPLLASRRSSMSVLQPLPRQPNDVLYYSSIPMTAISFQVNANHLFDGNGIGELLTSTNILFNYNYTTQTVDVSVSMEGLPACAWLDMRLSAPHYGFICLRDDNPSNHSFEAHLYDVPFADVFMDQVRICLARQDTVFGWTVAQITARHGWVGMMNYATAKQTLINCICVDRTETIYFWENITSQYVCLLEIDWSSKDASMSVYLIKVCSDDNANTAPPPDYATATGQQTSLSDILLSSQFIQASTEKILVESDPTSHYFFGHPSQQSSQQQQQNRDVIALDIIHQNQHLRKISVNDKPRPLNSNPTTHEIVFKVSVEDLPFPIDTNMIVVMGKRITGLKEVCLSQLIPGFN